jgi:hypothetical protein
MKQNITVVIDNDKLIVSHEMGLNAILHFQTGIEMRFPFLSKKVYVT